MPGWRCCSRASAAGMSPLACPAATSTSGTSASYRSPAATSWDTASVNGGRDSSMNPPPTGRPPARKRTRSTRAMNSATPAALRVPCPTTSSAGRDGVPVVMESPRSWGLCDQVGFREFGLRQVGIEQRVHRGGGDCGAALLRAVGNRRQPRRPQRRLGLDRADEADRQPHHQRPVSYTHLTLPTIYSV